MTNSASKNISKTILTLLFVFFIVLFHAGCKKSNPKSKMMYQTETWAFPYFKKVDSLNPILKPNLTLSFIDPITNKTIAWEARNTLNPSAIVRNDTVFLLYRAQDSSGTSRIGMAVSTDGLHFVKEEKPILFPANDEMKSYEWNYKKFNGPIYPNCSNCYFDGVEDPRVIEDKNGTYYMTYTAYDGKTARLSLATSQDLRTWKKHGLVFKSEKYIDMWSKSGAIVCKQAGDKMIATKIHGKYWMYFGDTALFIATSDDLIHWEIAENEESKEKISVLHGRMGYFDSRLVEPGPFAVIKNEGILLIYNGSNAANYNDPTLPKFTYSAGQALFDKNEPYKLVDRTQRYFITPDKTYEKIGEVNEVCFVEGLVSFKAMYYLYYGTADSKIAVARY